MRSLRPFTTRLINPITRVVAGWLPGFGLLTHVGRTTGRVYRIPINVFPHGDDYLFALTYGSDVQWVKNVIAAGGCEIQVRGRDVRLVEPKLLTDPDPRLMPLPVRLILGFNRVTEFLNMRRA
jgi:deazaflavin-dependent oxidoreductase (nitroreductase family)